MNTKPFPSIVRSSALLALALFQACTSFEDSPPKSSAKKAPPPASAPVASSAPTQAAQAPPSAPPRYAAPAQSPAPSQGPVQPPAPSQPVPAAASAPSAAAGVAAAETPAADPELDSMELGIPTQEEADLDAQQSIDADNADAALDELEQELEGGGG